MRSTRSVSDGAHPASIAAAISSYASCHAEASRIVRTRSAKNASSSLRSCWVAGLLAMDLERDVDEPVHPDAHLALVAVEQDLHGALCGAAQRERVLRARR